MKEKAAFKMLRTTFLEHPGVLAFGCIVSHPGTRVPPWSKSCHGNLLVGAAPAVVMVTANLYFVWDLRWQKLMLIRVGGWRWGGKVRKNPLFLLPASHPSNLKTHCDSAKDREAEACVTFRNMIEQTNLIAT